MYWISSVMPKPGSVHPKYREITVEDSLGNSFSVHSTYKNDVLTLDIAMRDGSPDHPAWKDGAANVIQKTNEVDTFYDKYGEDLLSDIL